MFSMMSRKQVVLLTSTILMIALITNFAGLIQDAEANPSGVITVNVTHACVDSDHGGQSDICQTVHYSYNHYIWPWVGHQWDDPHGSHMVSYGSTDKYKSSSVTSCSQCPNPPFSDYN